jgi:uncharacterized protein (DUF2252 family)
MQSGKKHHTVVPRTAHAQCSPSPDRLDPIAILEAQDTTRMPDLVPIRYGRMLESPFAFYRGAAAIMAGDLSTTPTTSIKVQLCGDAHCMNFGTFGTPERDLVFDVNDFDETLPGPFEWDVKRLAASFVIAGQHNGFTAAECADTARTAAASYRMRMALFAQVGHAEVYYTHVEVDNLLEVVAGRMTTSEEKGIVQARSHDSLQALHKLTSVVDGVPQIVDDPPIVSHIDNWRVLGDEDGSVLYQSYYETLLPDRRHLLDRYTLVDSARKVVGVGSVGTRCFILLFKGASDVDPLFLQIKEATESVLEPYLGRSEYSHHGQRVVSGQRITQAVSDIFLGWSTTPTGHFYLRQLRNMKGSVDPTMMHAAALAAYAEVCGWTLALAHARSGDAAVISGYLGTGDHFEQAIATFATTYAQQNERDYAALAAAVRSGRIEAHKGL